ncbi:class I adenylate-forming enzyme family protein [Glycomyces tritici]|uniref:Class I adenylate-forming enzyme family protein n=1 Tax=Glycomyces tritici TaxID=2665176 RepID=A0ABT7YX11_9ACTN|nr:class I adenylate-forming enzyme family protein [Glycomyces tritici]MDN3243176.1 class I adenylate-forming enzyme family protein [Glycomyces tritici]
MKTPLTIPGLLEERAARDPELRAVSEFDGSAMTYGRWWSEATRLAADLRGRGVPPGRAVAIALSEERLGEIAVAWIGVALSGAVPMLATGLEPSALRRGIETVRPVAVIHRLERSTDEVSGECPLEVRMEPLEHPPTASSDVLPADAALVLHTSGSTGEPKWVSCSSDNLLWGKCIWEARRKTDYLCAVSPRDALGMLIDAMCRGWTIVWQPHFNVPDFLDLAVRHQVRVASLYARGITRLNADECRPPGGLDRLRTIFVSGSPPTADAIARFQAVVPKAKILNLYTQTETWPEGAMMVYDGSRPDAVGTPTTGSEIRVTGADGSALLPNQVGEVWLFPARPARRYVGRTTDDRKGFTNGWIRTGDRGYVDDEGRLHLLDRWRAVIYRGFTSVSVAEVETVLSEHTQVTEAAVYGVPDPRVGEEVVAAVVVDSAVDEDDLLHFLLARLRPNQVPRHFQFVGELPRNAEGEVAKMLLRRRFDERQLT